MGLRLLSLVFFTVQLYGNSTASAKGAFSFMQKSTTSEFKRSKEIAFSPRHVLKESMLEGYPFTAAGVQPIVLSENVGKFSIAEVNSNVLGKGKTMTVYVLQIDASGESGYWLPQQRTIDIPKAPNTNDPKFVFTPDFTGGSLLVTPLNSLTLRLQRLEGNQVKDNDFSGYIYPMGVYSFAYMHFSEGEWLLHIQNRTCQATDSIFKKGQLKSIKMSNYDMKTSAEAFWIGNGGNLMKSQGLLCLFVLVANCWMALM